MCVMRACELCMLRNVFGHFKTEHQLQPAEEEKIQTMCELKQLYMKIY